EEDQQGEGHARRAFLVIVPTAGVIVIVIVTAASVVVFAVRMVVLVVVATAPVVVIMLALFVLVGVVPAAAAASRTRSLRSQLVFGVGAGITMGVVVGAEAHGPISGEEIEGGEEQEADPREQRIKAEARVE